MLRRMPLQRSERFPSVSPSLHPIYSRMVVPLHCLTAPYLADRVCWSLFCLGVYLLRPPSSEGCANWPTINKCIKVESDYNWSLRINNTRWNSDNVITQLTVTAVLNHLATWSVIVKNPMISLDHDRDLFGENPNFCNPVLHARAHTCEYAHTCIPLTCFIHRRLYHIYRLINSVVWCYKSWPEWWPRCNKQGRTKSTSYHVKIDTSIHYGNVCRSDNCS